MTSAPLTPAPQPLTLRELDAMAVSMLRGVGPKKVEALAQMGISTVADLLTHYPRRYVDRTREALVSDLRPGEEATVVVRVEQASSRRTRKGQSMTTVRTVDGQGATLGRGESPRPITRRWPGGGYPSGCARRDQVL